MLLNNNPLNIFHLDWIFIDTIIIILLIVLLILVKIYKITARWRSPFSNEALEERKYGKSVVDLVNQNITVKSFRFISNKNRNKRDHTKPTILLIRTNYRNKLKNWNLKNLKLLRVLTEGLCSYNFNVILINLEINPCPTCSPLDKKVQEDTICILSTILDFFQKYELIFNSKYFVINCYKSILSYNSVLSDNNNVGMILVNPVLHILNKENLTELINKSDVEFQLYTLFSKKYLFFLNNPNLKIFLRDFTTNNLNYFTLEKSRKYFKYYETILLGIIIDILERNHYKS